jgi:hypothetical protein
MQAGLRLLVPPSAASQRVSFIWGAASFPLPCSAWRIGGITRRQLDDEEGKERDHPETTPRFFGYLPVSLMRGSTTASSTSERRVPITVSMPRIITMNPAR